MATVRACSKLKISWKSVVFTNKVGKNTRYFVGVFNENNYSTRACWIWDDYSQLISNATLGARDFSSAVSGFCQVFIVTCASRWPTFVLFFLAVKISWKSVVFTNKVGKNTRYFVGVFNENNYSTRACWIWDDYSQLISNATLGARDFSSAVSGFCQVFIVTCASRWPTFVLFFLAASAYGRRCVGLRPTPKIPAVREKNLWYPG